MITLTESANILKRRKFSHNVKHVVKKDATTHSSLLAKRRYQNDYDLLKITVKI